MAGVDRISIRGLRDFQATLKAMDGQSQKKLRVALNAAAELVADRARRGVPTRSGKAKRSVKTASDQRTAQVKGGGAKAAYYPWLDFGGAVGPKRSVHRPFRDVGRYIYPAFSAQYDEVLAELEEQLADLARDAGLEVS